jgi:hypothetical protein
MIAGRSITARIFIVPPQRGQSSGSTSIFFGEHDLRIKLEEFRRYFNKGRVHSGIAFLTPFERRGGGAADLDLKQVRWNTYCNGLYRVPIAA